MYEELQTNSKWQYHKTMHGRNLTYNKGYSAIALPKLFYFGPFKYPEERVKEHKNNIRNKMHLCTGRSLTESDYTRCCINTIWPPEDEQDIARNIYM
jgi:hypothetical protein